MNPVRVLKNAFINLSNSAQLLAEIREGIANMTDVVARQGRGTEARIMESVEIAHVQPIAAVKTARDADDLVAEIMASGEYAACVEFFANSPSIKRSLVSPNTQAMLFSLLRILRPDHVIEIGTFKASTSEAMARALHANGKGVLYTIDPFGGETVPPIIASWPGELKKHLKFSVEDSMSLFGRIGKGAWRPGFVFVDGNHDYEFALFDILSAARFLMPGGVIVVDNIGQPGPALALEDFLKANPEWRQFGKVNAGLPQNLPYDSNRTRIHNTDMAIIQGPSLIHVRARPYTSGSLWFQGKAFHGLKLELAEAATGTLQVQLVFRQFGGNMAEYMVVKSIDMNNAAGIMTIAFDAPDGWDAGVANEIEPWLTWAGADSLKLASLPACV